MIFTTILITHIVFGVLSFLLAPFFIMAAYNKSKHFNAVKNGMSASIVGTFVLGALLIFAGAPLGRSCMTLTVYAAISVGLLVFGTKKAKSVRA